MKRLVTCLALFTFVAAAHADTKFSVKQGSTLTYKLVHKLHEVEGVSKAMDGKAILKKDGTVLVQLRARVDSFDSNNGNRDAHMKETTEAVKFPFVDLKASSAPGAITKPAGTVQLPLKGKLSFHGVERPFDSTFTVAFSDATHAKVTGSFPISLDGYGVERPSLMLVKVDDTVKIDASLVIEADK